MAGILLSRGMLARHARENDPWRFCAALRRIALRSTQLVIAAPPYHQVLPHAWDQQWRDVDGYLSWSIEWMAGATRALREDGLLYCFGQLGKREYAFLHLMLDAGNFTISLLGIGWLLCEPQLM